MKTQSRRRNSPGASYCREAFQKGKKIRTGEERKEVRGMVGKGVREGSGAQTHISQRICDYWASAHWGLWKNHAPRGVP